MHYVYHHHAGAALMIKHPMKPPETVVEAMVAAEIGRKSARDAAPADDVPHRDVC